MNRKEMNREEMNRKEKEKDEDSVWDKWCEKREMDEAVHENVIVINYINDITVYYNHLDKRFS